MLFRSHLLTAVNAVLLDPGVSVESGARKLRCPLAKRSHRRGSNRPVIYGTSFVRRQNSRLTTLFHSRWPQWLRPPCLNDSSALALWIVDLFEGEGGQETCPEDTLVSDEPEVQLNTLSTNCEGLTHPSTINNGLRTPCTNKFEDLKCHVHDCWPADQSNQPALVARRPNILQECWRLLEQVLAVLHLMCEHCMSMSSGPSGFARQRGSLHRSRFRR